MFSPRSQPQFQAKPIVINPGEEDIEHDMVDVGKPWFQWKIIYKWWWEKPQFVLVCRRVSPWMIDIHTMSLQMIYFDFRGFKY